MKKKTHGRDTAILTNAAPLTALIHESVSSYYRIARSRKCWAVISLLLFVSLVQIPSLAQQSSTGFQNSALRIAHQFASSKDLHSLQCVSEYGLTITDRYVAPDSIHDIKIPGGLNPDSKLEPHRIIEDSVDVAPSEYSQETYKALVARIRGYVSNTLSDWNCLENREIVISQSAHDKWGARLLGPAVVGKVAAGTYWYLYLRKEHGYWKIWKLEYDE